MPGGGLLIYCQPMSDTRKVSVITWKKRVTFAGIIIALMLMTLEGLVRLAARSNLVNIRAFCTSNEVTPITYTGNLNPYFGIWHLPDVSVQVSTPSGNVVYETNAQGMRDRPRKLPSSAPERVVVLGDSFVEGCHVAASNRFTNILEQETKIEFLNFGTSGGFGSIQEWLLYENLAAQFEHTRVLLFFLPDNDFADNDPPRHVDADYRPFLCKSNGIYAVRYPSPFRKKLTRENRITWGRAIRHWCYNHCYTANLLATFDFEKIRDLNTSSYDQYTKEDLAQFLFTCEQLLSSAHPRALTIYIIPRDRDFIAFNAGDFQGRLPSALARWAASQKRVEVVDLFPGFLAYMNEHHVAYQDFFLGFDPHWSPLGHRVAASLVLANLSGLKPNSHSGK